MTHPQHPGREKTLDEIMADFSPNHIARRQYDELMRSRTQTLQERIQRLVPGEPYEIEITIPLMVELKLTKRDNLISPDEALEELLADIVADMMKNARLIARGDIRVVPRVEHVIHVEAAIPAIPGVDYLQKANHIIEGDFVMSSIECNITKIETANDQT